MDCKVPYSSAGIIKLQQGILKSAVVQEWREEMMWAMEHLCGEDKVPNNTLDCH